MTQVTDAAYGENNLHRVANDAEGTPASDVTGSATSFDLESGEGSDFPADTFTIFVPSTGEYIFVGNRSGDTLSNLTRDFDGDLGGGQAIADEDEVRLVKGETSMTQITDVLDELTNVLRGEEQKEVTVQLESTDGTHSVTVEDSGGNTIFDVLSNGNWSDGTNTVYDAANTRIGSNLVDTTSIDESIAPTWTGAHTFNGGLTMGSTLTMNDAQNISVGSTTGTQIATAATQMLGFFGTTPVSQQTAPQSLTDNTGGTTDGTLAAVSGSGDDSTINNNLAELAEEVNQLRTVVVNLGLAA